MSKKTTYTLTNLKEAFNRTNNILATISYTRMSLLAIAVLGNFGEAKLKEDTITQKEASEVFGVSKSYVSQCIKVARYIIDNNIVDIVNDNSERFDLAKMYRAVGEADDVEEFIDAFDLKRPQPQTDEAEAEAEDEDETEHLFDEFYAEDEAEAEAEDETKNGLFIDNDDMVHISLNGLIYRIPMDILEIYKV